MLKITYSDSGVWIEQSGLTVESLVAQRSLVALRAGQSLVMQPGYGSFLLQADLPRVEALTLTACCGGGVEVVPCDAHWLEVTLRGIWITDHLTSDAGILVAQLEEALERRLVALWRLSLSRAMESCPQSTINTLDR